VAGNVALMFGTEVMDQDTNQTVSIVQTDDGNFWSMAMLAQVKLGITPGWAEQLFSGGNTATSVRRIAESITKAACEEWYRE
jgi:hypothetical protein